MNLQEISKMEIRSSSYEINHALSAHKPHCCFYYAVHILYSTTILENFLELSMLIVLTETFELGSFKCKGFPTGAETILSFSPHDVVQILDPAPGCHHCSTCHLVAGEDGPPGVDPL